MAIFADNEALERLKTERENAVEKVFREREEARAAAEQRVGFKAGDVVFLKGSLTPMVVSGVEITVRSPDPAENARDARAWVHWLDTAGAHQSAKLPAIILQVRE